MKPLGAMAFEAEETDAMAALIEGVRQDMMLAMMGELQVVANSCAEICVQRLLELRVEVSSAVEEEVRHHCSDLRQAAELQEAVRTRMSFLDLFKPPPGVVREMTLEESEIGPGESDNDGHSSLEEAYERLDQASSGRLTVCQRPGCNEIAPQNCCTLLCRKHCTVSRCSAHGEGSESRKAQRERVRAMRASAKDLRAADAVLASTPKDKVTARDAETPATPSRWSELGKSPKDEELSGHSEDSTEAAQSSQVKSDSQYSLSEAVPDAHSEALPEAPSKIEEEPEEAGDGEPLVIETGDVLEVIGGSTQGGILVRKGRTVASPQMVERLATGALIRALHYDRGRLRYELVEGSGPAAGWVSAEWKGKALLRLASRGSEALGEDETEDSPLSLAVRDGDEDLVRQLLLQRANPNELDSMGEPPLFEAVMNHAHSLVALLLVAGADPDHCTSLEVTAATLADGDVVTEELLQYPDIVMKSDAAEHLQRALKALEALPEPESDENPH